jgi:hypothetical protein
MKKIIIKVKYFQITHIEQVLLTAFAQPKLLSSLEYYELFELRKVHLKVNQLILSKRFENAKKRHSMSFTPSEAYCFANLIFKPDLIIPSDIIVMMTATIQEMDKQADNNKQTIMSFYKKY